MSFPLWLRLFNPSGAISPLFSSSILDTYWPGVGRGFIFQCHIFLPFHTVLGFSRQECWSGLPFPSPVDHVLSEFSTMTRPSYVTLHGMAHSFIELDKTVVHVIWLASFLWFWFSFCLPSDALSQHLPSYLGFSYPGWGVSLHGYSSKAQPLLLTLDKRYSLILLYLV